MTAEPGFVKVGSAGRTRGLRLGAPPAQSPLGTRFSHPPVQSGAPRRFNTPSTSPERPYPTCRQAPLRP